MPTPRRRRITPSVSARPCFLPTSAPGPSAWQLPAPAPVCTAITRIANLRSRWLQLPYGDQGLFLPANLFFRLGGFPEQPIMEDFALVRKVRRYGRVITLPQTVLTSGRRWQHLGLWRTTSINQLMIFGYYFGVAPATLARIYRQRHHKVPGPLGDLAAPFFQGQQGPPPLISTKSSLDNANQKFLAIF